MRRTFFVVASLFVFLIAVSVAAEDGNERYRVRLKSGETVHLYEGELRLDGVEGKVKRDSILFVPEEDIDVLYRYGGSKAWKYGRAGALCGLGVSAVLLTAAIIEASHSPGVEVDGDKALRGTVILCTSGLAVGALLGSVKQKWEFVPVNIGLHLPSGDGGGKLTLCWSF